MLSLIETITFNIRVTFDSENYLISLIKDHDLEVMFTKRIPWCDYITLTIKCSLEEYEELCDILREDDLITATIWRDL